MSDKFDDFMKRNSPPAEGALKKLHLPEKRNWLAGVAISSALAATLVVTMVNRRDFDSLDEGMEVSFEDDFPAEYQDVESLLEEI